ncbi:hypothetical protein O1M54_47280 [Streptomyces diastatochromogenes]|nr:hypothetical protein [Streptomyces diastatochromogenes]
MTSTRVSAAARARPACTARAARSCAWGSRRAGRLSGSRMRPPPAWLVSAVPRRLVAKSAR